MKQMRSFLVIVQVLLIALMAMAPLQASAQGILVDPTTLDFGAIPVGTSDTAVVTVESTEPIPLRVESVEILDDASGSFSIVSDHPPPTVTLYQGERLYLTVEFTPSELFEHSAWLYIRSDAEAPDDNWYVPLQGVGVSGSTIEDIKDFFDDSVEGGTLEGSGTGDSADGRLNALRNMLDMAGDLISFGDIEGACGQLHAVLDRCDGDMPPPDFVSGDAVSELSSMIIGLMEELGCE